MRLSDLDGIPRHRSVRVPVWLHFLAARIVGNPRRQAEARDYLREVMMLPKAEITFDDEAIEAWQAAPRYSDRRCLIVGCCRSRAWRA